MTTTNLLSGDSLILGLVFFYLSVFFLALFFKRFRESFFEWLSMKDAFGVKFWAKNWWFLVLTICVGVVAFLSIAGAS